MAATLTTAELDTLSVMRTQARSGNVLFALVSCATAFATCVEARGGQQTPTKSGLQICRQVAAALERERSQAHPKSLFVNSIEEGGRFWRYQGLDIDRDNKPDELLQSCGSPSEGACTLSITLTKGGGYNLSEETFKVIRFRSRPYAVVGDSFPPDRTGYRRLYALTERGARLLCKSF